MIRFDQIHLPMRIVLVFLSQIVPPVLLWAAPASNITQAPQGILAVPAPGARSAVYIHDGILHGSWGQNWLSYPGHMTNTFEFTLDRNQDGITGEAGDVNDLYQLDSVALYLSGNNRSLQKFTLEVQNNQGSWQPLFAPNTPNPFNFASAATGGQIAYASPSLWPADKMIDGATTNSWDRQNWLSYPGHRTNTFEFVFDPNLNGTPAEAADQFTLDEIALFLPGNNRSLQKFTLEVQNNQGSWQPLFAPNTPNPFNFASAATGGQIAYASPSLWPADKMIDGATTNSWDRQNWLSYPGQMTNAFAFVFDPNLNGTPAEAADQFTLDEIALFLPGNNRSLKDFIFQVKTTSGWQPPISLHAAKQAGEQVFPVGPYPNTIRVRFLTLSNYGDTYMQINEFEARGQWRGPNPVFTASQVAGEQRFDLTTIPQNNDGRRNNITRLRLKTRSNYGNTYTQINEFEARGQWRGPNPVFTASQVAGEQRFDLTTIPQNNDGRRNNITRLRFKTLSNYGNVYMQIDEFQGFGRFLTLLPGAFNAFDSSTPAHAIMGSLTTRIADQQPIVFDVVALNPGLNAVDTAFSGMVSVELLANMGPVTLDNHHCPVTATLISSQPAALITGGRSTVTLPAVNNVWKDVRVRIRYSQAGKTVTSCAVDNFAIRPARFSLHASHNNWERAGTHSQIESASSQGVAIHKAGAPFTLTVTAQDTGGNVMTNYTGAPVMAPHYPKLAGPVGGHLGQFTIGTLTTQAGISRSSQARYSEVGNVTIQLVDADFAAVDATDGSTTADREIRSPAVTIGRFVPDHFEYQIQNTGSFGGAANACSGFTYFGQPFSYLVRPELKVTALNAATPPAVTQNYTGSYAKLTVSDFSLTPPTTDAHQLNTQGGYVALNWTAAAPTLTDNQDGSLTFQFGADTYTYLQQSDSLVAPFINAVNLTFTQITDSDHVSAIHMPATLTPSGTLMRFGRLAITNAHGSELTPITLPVVTEYFDGYNWTLNTMDNCTQLNLSTHIRLSNPASGNNRPGDTAMIIENGTSTAQWRHSPFAAGHGDLTFSAPGKDNQGYIDIHANLDGFDWLKFDWDNDGRFSEAPSGRVSFGLYQGSDVIIFRRERD